MPQLFPFYFVNQVTFVVLVLMILLYVFSYYILPGIVSWFNSRFFSDDI